VVEILTIRDRQSTASIEYRGSLVDSHHNHTPNVDNKSYRRAAGLSSECLATACLGGSTAGRQSDLVGRRAVGARTTGMSYIRPNEPPGTNRRRVT